MTVQWTGSSPRRRIGRCRISARRASDGAVLIVGLVVLLVVTLIGVSGIQTSVLQDRMVGNLRQDQLALQAAETALQAGLSYVESLKRPPDSGEIDFILNSCKYASDAACANWDAVLTNWRGSAESVNEGTSYGEVARRLETDGSEITVTLPEVAFQPRIYIQSHYLRPLDAEAAARGVGPHLFEVSAVGFGADANARVILQSTAPKVFSWH